MIDFDWWWAFAALPLPWLLHALLPPAPARGALALPIAGELGRLAADGDRAGRWRLPWLTVLAWLLLVVAAAQPRWVGDPVQLPASGRDLLLAVGSTLSVYPVAGLVPIAKESGARIVIMNGEPTAMDDIADAVLLGDLNEVLPRVLAGTAHQ